MPTITQDMQMLSLELFDAAFAIVPGTEDEVKRRFMTLFARARGRRGGSAEVCQATNAFGETFALKRLRVADENRTSTDSGPQVAAGSSAPSPAGKQLRHTIAGSDSPTPAGTPDYVTQGHVATFYEEYRVHLALSHLRGFPQLFGFGLADGNPVIIMEWVEGITLRDAMRTWREEMHELLPLATVAELGIAVTRLLQRAGELDEGFVHRDLSPRNIMLRTDRIPAATQLETAAFDLCLVDFGSATLLAPSGEPTFTAQTNLWRMGTPAYAPPEMLSSDITPPPGWRQSSAIDVYALCSVLFELYSGRKPFEVGPQDPRSPFVIKTQTEPRALELREPDGGMLAATIRAGLALRQEDRPTLAALHAALANWLELPEQSPPKASTPAFDRGFWEPGYAQRAITRRAVVAGGILAVSSLASGAIVTSKLLRARNRTPDTSGYPIAHQPYAGDALFRAYDGMLQSWVLATREGHVACKLASSRPCGNLREGAFALYDDRTKRYGFAVPTDDAGVAWLILPQFAQADDFNEELAAVKDAGTRLWGYADASGELVIPARYTAAGAFSHGAAPVCSADEPHLRGAIDASGAWLIEPQFAALGARSDDGFAAAQAADGPGLWGIVDADGTWACTPSHPQLRRFAFGCAPAIDATSGLWGYVDAGGNWTVKPTFSDARPFCDAHDDLSSTDELQPLAAVQDASTQLWYFADLDGRAHHGMKPCFWKLGDLHDGLAPAQASADDDTVVFDEADPDSVAEAAGMRYGYVDATGTWQMRQLTELLDTVIGPAEI